MDVALRDMESDELGSAGSVPVGLNNLKGIFLDSIILKVQFYDSRYCIHRHVFSPKPFTLFQIPDFKPFSHNASLLKKNLKCRLRYLSSLYRTHRLLDASEG